MFSWRGEFCDVYEAGNSAYDDAYDADVCHPVTHLQQTNVTHLEGGQEEVGVPAAEVLLPADHLEDLQAPEQPPRLPVAPV